MKVYEAYKNTDNLEDEDYLITSPINQSKSIIFKPKGNNVECLNQNLYKHKYIQIDLPFMYEIHDGDFMIIYDYEEGDRVSLFLKQDYWGQL